MARHRTPHRCRRVRKRPHAAALASEASSRRPAAACAWERGYAVSARPATMVTHREAGATSRRVYELNLRVTPTRSTFAMYRADTSAEPTVKGGDRARARDPGPPARDPHARVRAAQAADGQTGRVPSGDQLRLAVSDAAPDAERRMDHRGVRDGGSGGRGATADQTAQPGGLQDHCRGQGTLPGTARQCRAGDLRRPRLRRALRVLRPHRSGDPAAHPRRPPPPGRGALRGVARRALTRRRATRRIHIGTTAARSRRVRARGPLGGGAHRPRAIRADSAGNTTTPTHAAFGFTGAVELEVRRHTRWAPSALPSSVSETAPRPSCRAWSTTVPPTPATASLA